MISDAAGVGDDQGFTLTGPTATGSQALLELANPQVGGSVITLDDASNVTIENIPLENGVDGVLAIDGSMHLSLLNVTTSHNSADGVHVDSTSSVGHMSFVTSTFNGGYGVYIAGSLGTLDDSTVSDNQSTGIYLLNPGSAIVEANDVTDNRGDGIYVSNQVPGTTAVIGNADVSQGLGNVVEGNALDGIEAYGGVSVAGNAVSGSAGSNEAGIFLLGAAATNNVVFGNAVGIDAFYAGNIVGNRVYDNTGVGIYSYQSGDIEMNVVYSNLIGIQTFDTTSQIEISNNLVYANADDGLLIEANLPSNQTLVLNNTVYQPTGDAVHIDDQSSDVDLVDNILWTFTGFDISVASDSQVGFASDYNDLMTSDSGQVGQWQGLARPDLLAWHSADQTDTNSLSVDPLFVNPMGADGLLGYSSPTEDGRDDDFHEQSLYGSFHGGSLAPVINLTTGRPTLLTPVLTDDPNQSPVIDRGDPTAPYQNEPLPNGNFVNLGAYGDTAQASLSPSQYLIVSGPADGQAWQQGQTFDIQWRTQDSNIANSATVQINLLQAGNPTPVVQIADNAPNNGVYAWTVPTNLPPANNYLIQVTLEDSSGLSAVSGQPVTIAPPVHVYYVNDGTVVAGGYATAPGNDGNDGLTPATPKASIAAILDSYQLQPGDTILVDEGTYDLSSNIVLDAADSGIIIRGFFDPNDPSAVTILDRENTNTGGYAFDLQGATNVTLDHLDITGAYAGINASSGAGSTGLTVSNTVLYDNSTEGAEIQAGNDNPTFVNDTIYTDQTNSSIQFYGLDISADGAVVSGNTVYSNEYGINATGNNAQITGNEVFGNSIGISSSGGGSLVSGNTVHDNDVDIEATTIGASGVAAATVSGNTVYGSNSSVGIIDGDYDVIVTGNTVHDIAGNGIEAYVDAIVEDNQVYHNAADGILVGSFATVTGNHVYANNIGIEVNTSEYESPGALVSTNVVEGNTLAGIHVTGSGNATSPVQVVNNTVIQEQGNAIQVDDFSNNVQLLNNILWAQSGYAITVAPDSEVGFQSDYNDLYSTGAGQIGLWEGQSFSNLAEWYYEVGLDQHSIDSNPQFIDPAGPDGVIGYSNGMNYGADDNFHLLPNSPAVDAGDPNSPFLEEPVPNGGRVDLAPMEIRRRRHSALRSRCKC